MGSFVVDWDNALHKPGQDEIYLTCWNIYPNELGNDNNAEERTEFTFNLFRDVLSGSLFFLLVFSLCFPVKTRREELADARG